MVREIRVDQFDPEKDKFPADKGVLKAKIRTKWYLVNISLFANDLMGDICEKGKISSDLTSIGSPGMGKIRTFWDITITLGVPFSRWGAMPYIVHPLPFPSGIFSCLISEVGNQKDSEIPRLHPCQLAARWRQQIERNPGISQAKIAAREGLSRARVTQIMNLLQLPEEIQEELQCPPAPLEIHSFSERSLRRLLSCDNRESQLHQWCLMVQDLKRSADK